MVAESIKLKKLIEKFESINERDAVYGDIVDEDGELVEFNIHPRCASLNDVINEDGDELIDTIQDNSQDNDTFTPDNRIKEEIHKLLSVLTERERGIIECYYGLNIDSERMTLEAIGEKYDLTKERIRQIKEKALRKLRHSSQSLFNLLKDY